MSIIPSDAAIAVSGAGVPLNAVQWPSGQFAGVPGSGLCAFLASITANFGFNLQPHAFQTEWVPCGDPCAFHGASGQLPPIGHPIEFQVGEFELRGIITHADYISSNQGTIVNVSIEDDRKSLRRVKIHTEDLGGQSPSGVVSVAQAYRALNGLTDINGNPSDPLVREYRRILEIGATYSQILDAIDYFNGQDAAAFAASDLPSSDKLEANIGGSIDDIRFQFNLTPLDEAMTRVLQDSGFDWYWNMSSNEVNLINKKLEFSIDEADILNLVSEFGSASGLNETKQISYGQDIVPDPTRFRLLGGHQRGFLNSRLLSPIDGLDTFEVDNQDGTVNNFGGVVFTKVWDQLTVGFYDSQGFYRTYVPTEKELQLALAGIEQWTYYKIYQSTSTAANPPGYGLPSDAGSIAAQDPTFQSRLDPLMGLAGEATSANSSGIRIISNRRDENHNWVLAFYSRIRDHASRHYGRSYVASGILFNEGSGLFRLINAAWANVENQIEGQSLSASGSTGPFVEDYEINQDLGPISPFVTDDFQVTAHCVMPADTVYGPQGDDVPASFSNWTEDAPPFNPNGDGSHYIPVELTVVGQRVINPRDDDLYAFEAFPEGTVWCQLPSNAGAGRAIDGVINSLDTLLSTRTKLTGSGLLDIINPGIVLNAYGQLSGVAIPIEARTRYGQIFPTTWVEGTQHFQRDEDVQLDDQYVPWAFSPEGTNTSIGVMTNRAMSRVRGKIVNSSTSRFADFTQVGLPLITFDGFSNQGIGSNGLYGEIKHGVSELNIQFTDEGFTTRYKVASYFPRFGRDAPLGERVRAILNGIINPVDFSFLRIGDQFPPSAPSPFIDAEPVGGPLFFDTERRAVRVTISSVRNVFTLGDAGSTPQRERYRGVDRNGYVKPFPQSSTNLDFSEGAICVDGFLNIGDEALYHTDSFEQPGGGTVIRYFTGGRPFGNGTIVTVAAARGSNYDVTIVDPTAAGNGIERALIDVPLLNGSINVGEQTTLVAQGDADVTPGLGNDGIFINGTSFGAGVVPVEIISVTNQGLLTATCVCQELNSDGSVTSFALDSNGDVVNGSSNGDTYSGVVPIPFRQFATSGNRGFLATTTVPSASTGSGTSVSFVEIVTPPMIRYS